MYYQTALLHMFFFPGHTSQNGEGFRSPDGKGWVSLPVSSQFPTSLLCGNIAVRQEKSLLWSSVESRERSCPGILSWHTALKRTISYSSCNKYVPQEELLKLLEVRARTLEVSALRSGGKDG